MTMRGTGAALSPRGSPRSSPRGSPTPPVGSATAAAIALSPRAPMPTPPRAPLVNGNGALGSRVPMPPREQRAAWQANGGRPSGAARVRGAPHGRPTQADAPASPAAAQAFQRRIYV